MYIEKYNGVEHQYFELGPIMVHNNTTQINVIDMKKLNKGEEVSSEIFIIPDEQLTSNDLEADVHNWLISELGPFSAGSLIEDSYYELGRAKIDKKSLIKNIRVEKETSGLPTSFGVVDSDADSQRKISGAVQMAMLSEGGTLIDGVTTRSQAFFPTGFQIQWRFKDNSIVPLNASQMIQLGVEVGKQVAQYQMVKNYFDNLVDSATTVEEVESIDIDVNWLQVDLSAATA